MKASTYRAVQELLLHFDGWNPPVRARLIAVVRELMEQERDPHCRPVLENPYHPACVGYSTNSTEKSHKLN
jgi:hypothetical protein